jgi:translation initiation factor IF-1
MKLVRAKSARAQAAAAAAAVDALLQAIAGRPGMIAQPAPKTFGAALVATATIMNSEKAIEIEGTIMHVLPGTMFRVALANNNLVLAHISGKMRKRFIRLTIGDRVKMEMSPYDTAKARIVYRL